MQKYPNAPQAGKVSSQAKTIWPNTLRSAVLPPTPSTAAVLVWVVETGSPHRVVKSRLIDPAKSE